MSKRSLARAIQIQSLHRVRTQWIVSRTRYVTSAGSEGIDDLYSAGCSQAGMSRCRCSTRQTST
jgi:hypothetical protein